MESPARISNVVVINDYAHVNGGAASVAIDSALGLAGAGLRVYFISVVGPVDPRLYVQKNLEVFCSDGVDILNNPHRWRAAIYGWYNTSEGCSLTKILRHIDPASTIVHVHGWMKAFSPGVFLWLRQAGFRVVVTLHDYFIACPNGAFLDYSRGQNCGLRALSLSCIRCNCDSRSYPQKLWRFGRGLLQQHIFDFSSTVSGYIGVSQFALDKIDSYLPANIRKIVIRNPLSVPFDSNPAGDPQGPLLFAGRLSVEKAPLLAAAAARKLGRKIRFIGDGPLLATLKREYPEAECLGWLPRERLLEFMRNSSVLVFPSIWLETNGLVIVEALSQGLPVLISEGIAASEFAEDSTRGRLFRIGDVEDMVEQLNYIYRNWNEMNIASHKWYWDDPWTLEKHTNSLINLYTDLLSSGIKP